MPRALQQHLSERVRERKITASVLAALDLWLQSGPDIPEGEWFKDFHSFILGGEGHC
jgi:hypothetical protein